MSSGSTEAGPTPRERLISVGLFLATLTSCFVVYGTFWEGGRLTDPAVAWHSLQFAVALMGILLAHEMGHYVVARRHGFALSLPYFIPFPMAFGTFGAIIRLRSMPRSRSALLEMGAAGPLAGLSVAILALALGLPGTGDAPVVEVERAPVVEAPVQTEPGVLERADQAFQRAVEVLPEGVAERILGPEPAADEIPVLIFNNPLLFNLMGRALLGKPPGRFDTLTPLALAGWVGCLLTAINLLPIGQLDGGHILNGLSPRAAPWVSKVLLGLAIAGVLFWAGWGFWALLLFFSKAWRSLPVPREPGLTPRAKLVAGIALVAFALTFMPIPIELDVLQVTFIEPAE